MKTITKEEWKRKVKLGYGSLINGQRHILAMTDKGTSLVPVEIKEEDRPEYGKVYALTGGSNKPCIANGNSWKESEVKNN